MRLWSIWNLLSSFLYFVGWVIGMIFLALILNVFLPPVIAWTFAALVICGVAIAIAGIIAERKQRKHDEHTDAELAEITGHKTPK